MVKAEPRASSDKSEQSLKAALVNMGLDPKGLEAGLVLPNEKKIWFKELVSEHLTRHGVSTTSGLITAADGTDDEVLFIDEPPGPISAATPVLLRIAAGIKRHHNGARLAVDVSGNIVTQNARGTFESSANTIVIPWSLVIDPGSVRATETFGHELIHLKQLSDGRSGIEFQPIGSLGTCRTSQRFYSCEIEAHLFNLRRAFRRFPAPHELSAFPRTELDDLLQTVASEAKYISEYCQLLKTSLPLLHKAMQEGEPFVCLRKASESPISRWGIVIGRGTDDETLAVFQIRNGPLNDFWRSLQAQLNECEYILNAHYEQCSAVRDQARSTLVSHLLNRSLLGKAVKLLCALLRHPTDFGAAAEYAGLYRLGAEYRPGLRGEEIVSRGNELENQSRSTALFEDVNTWLAQELQREQPALQAILLNHESMGLSKERYQHLAVAVEKHWNLVNVAPRQAGELIVKLIGHGDHEGALRAGLFLLEHAKNPSPFLYNNVAWLLSETGDTTGKAVEYAKKAVALSKAADNATYRRFHRSFEDTLAEIQRSTRKSVTA